MKVFVKTVNGSRYVVFFDSAVVYGGTLVLKRDKTTQTIALADCAEITFHDCNWVGR